MPLSALRALSPFWLRLFAVFMLLFAAPGTATVVQEVLVIAGGVDCCGDRDETGAHDGDECPGSCMHCRCAHPSAVVATWVPLVSASLRSDEMAFPGPVEQLSSVGYREPPFRPPAG